MYNLLIQVLLCLSSAVTLGVQVPHNVRPCLTASFETVPFLSPLTTCKAMVEVF
jgi:hypothetical protein